MEIVDVTAAVVVQDKKILLAKRGDGGRHPGRWEFPGGKVEPGETRAECLAREMMEEMGIEVSVGERLAEVEYSYSDMHIRLAAFKCEIREGCLQDIGCAAHVWVKPDEFEDYNLLPPDRILWGQVLKRDLLTTIKLTTIKPGLSGRDL
ncbi:MAG: (deoxy)nucleoside triphosphate pyrophosphohydrolase [Actinobacteria bacterium]|nr:(deoxy)nucleoside triphosphate pyrophosphohydrolase [Actinomycetota bacterium]